MQDERPSVLLSTKLYAAVAGQFLLRLAHESIQTRLDIRESLANMRHQRHIQDLGQELSATSLRNVSVSRMKPEEFPLIAQRVFERFAVLDVLLRAVDDGDEPEFQGIHPTRKDVHGVCAVIHEIDLGQHPDCSDTQGVNMARKLQRLGIDNVNIGRRHGENDTIRLGDVLGDQVARLFLDIGRLIADGYLCQARQIHESQVEDLRRKDLEVYGLAIDALVVTGDPRRLILNFLLDISEIGVPLTRLVIELGPLG